MKIQPSRNRTLQLAWSMVEAARKKDAKAAKDEAPKLAHPKDNLVVSEAYRRLVAMGACEHCGLAGYSQAAHLPPEGKQIKVTDLDTFALCTVHPGPDGIAIEGCHFRFDQYQLFPREQAIKRALVWIRATQRRVYATGKWPKNVPVPAWLEKTNAKSQATGTGAAAAAAGARGKGRQGAADPGQAVERPADRRRARAAAGGRDARGAAKPAGRKRQ